MHVRVCVCLCFVFVLVFNSTYMANKDEYKLVSPYCINERYRSARAGGQLSWRR